MERFHREDIEAVKITVNPLFPLMSVYLYFVDGLLVDTGPRIRRNRLIPVFKSWEIEQVAITHLHEDHAGMASWLAKHTGTNLYVHQKGIQIAARAGRMPWYRKLYAGKRPAFTAKPFPDVIETEKHQFYPIYTPGHSSDHVCLYEPKQGWLFTGDLYVTPYPKVFLRDESIEAYIQTLKKLNDFDYRTIFCGHEGAISNGKEMMNKKRAYLESVRSEVRRMHRAGFDDKTIMKKMFPGSVKLERLSFGTFSRLHLIRSCYREYEPRGR